MGRFARLLSFLFAITIMCNIKLPGAQAAAISDAEMQEEFTFLTAIGVLSDDDFSIYEADDLLLRKELAVSVCRLLHVDGVTDTLTAAPFLDVPVSDASAAAIGIASDIGILNGYGNGLFGPDDVAAYEQAVKAIVSVLGYDDYAQQRGGYPVGYTALASEKGILKGIQAAGSGTLTKRDFIHMMVNALEVDIALQVVYGETDGYTVNKGRTILSEYLKIEKGEGILNATSETGLSTDNMLGSGRVQIGRQIFQAGDSAAEQYLGYQVSYYAADGNAGDKVLLFVHSEQSPDDELVVPAKNIDAGGTTRGVFSYWEDVDSGRKPKTKRLSPVADMIYNGKAYPAFTVQELVPKTGFVKLLDRDADGQVDVIFVTSYETVIVDSVSHYNATVLNKYTYEGCLTSVALDREESQYDVHILKYGEEIGLEELKEWDVLSVAASKNSGKKRVEVQVCDDIAVGTLSEIWGEDRILIDDGESYRLSQDFISEKAQNNGLSQNFKVGATLTFRLDIYGDVAFVGGGTAQEGNRYAYLFKMGFDGTLDKKIKARIFTDTADWMTVPLADRVEFNGKSCDAEEVLEELAIVQNGKVVHLDRQLVLFQFNGQGQIKLLKTAQSFADISDADAKYQMQVQAGKDDDFWVREQSTKYYRSTNRSFASTIYLRSDVKIFIIPTETYADDEDNYFVEDVSYLRNDNSYTFTSYAEDEYQHTSLIMIQDDITLSSRTSNRTTYNSLYVVDKIRTGLIGKDLVQKLYGVVGNQEDICVNGEDEAVFNALEIGDVIQLRFNGNGRVDDYFMVYKVSDGRMLSNRSVDADGNRVIVYGNVTAVDLAEKRIKLNDGTEKVFSFNLNTPKVSLYDHSLKRVTIGALTDIEVNDFLVFRIRDSRVEDIVIYKNY